MTDECGTAEDTLSLTVGDGVVEVDAGADLSFCATDSIALSGTVSAGSIYTWSGGLGTFADASSLTTYYYPSEDEVGFLNLSLSADNGLWHFHR